MWRTIRPSVEDDHGVVHNIHQAEGGEQGDALIGTFRPRPTRSIGRSAVPVDCWREVEGVPGRHPRRDLSREDWCSVRVAPERVACPFRNPEFTVVWNKCALLLVMRWSVLRARQMLRERVAGFSVATPRTRNQSVGSTSGTPRICACPSGPDHD